jgi:hypothetical protein
VTAFTGPAEFRRVFDLLFSVLSRDRRFGPRLRALGKAQRFVIRDLALTLDVDGVREGSKGAENLRWTWNGKGCSWEPAAVLELDAGTANAFFQGRVNLAVALLSGRISVVDGSAAVPLDTLPILKGFYPVWSQRVRHEGWDHLVA